MKHTEGEKHMKAKHVFLTLGLSLTMAGSVAAAGLLGAASNMSVRPAEAAVRTIYCKNAQSWWKADGAAVGVYCWGTGGTKAPYPGERMTAVSGETDLWSFDVDTAQYENVIFTRVNGEGAISDWGAKTKNLTFPTDSKDLFTITTSTASWGDPGCDGEWSNLNPVTSYSVDVYIDGVKRGTETIDEGYLPNKPTYALGKKFDGWYTTADYQKSSKIDGVSSTTTVLYGRIVDAENRYFLHNSGWVRSNTFLGNATDKFYIYIWNDSGSNNAAWPGELEGEQTMFNGEGYINVPENAKFIFSNATQGLQTVTIDPTGIANGDEIILLDSTDSEGHYNITWKSLLDEPDEEGYYICGNFSSVPSWTYSGATKMTNTTGENVAHHMNFFLGVDDELRVRSFYTDRTPYDQWATLGDNGYADPDNGWGVKSGNNFKATKAGYYDVFAKYVGDNFMFYVAPHVDSYQINLSAVLFEGKLSVATQALDYQLAYDGQAFDPTKPNIDGYVARGVYTDIDCLNPYTSTTFSASDSLFIKYTRLGFYVAGDAAYTGDADTAWKVDGATYLPTATNDPNNMLEGSVTITDDASATNPVKVKALQYVGGDTNNGWQAISYTMPLADDYSFVSLDEDSNFVFTKGGTYAVYVNNSAEVYLSEGAQAFYTKFLNEVGSVCSEVVSGTKTLENLKAVWLEQKAAYQSLSAEEKDLIVAMTIDGGSETGSDLEKVIAKYKYIVQKYGTNNCEDFIWGQTYVAQSNGFNLINNNSAMIIIAVAVSVVAISAVGLYFIIRRKRLVK